MIGKTLKHYQIETVLGKGGMGTVYRARDTRLQRSVAIKVLSVELTSDPERKLLYEPGVLYLRDDELESPPPQAS